MQNFHITRVHVQGFKTERCDTAECPNAHSFEIHQHKYLFGKEVPVYRGIHETKEQAEAMVRQMEE